MAPELDAIDNPIGSGGLTLKDGVALGGEYEGFKLGIPTPLVSVSEFSGYVTENETTMKYTSTSEFPPVFVAVMVTLELLYVAAGSPVIAPVEGLSDSPAGSAPAVTAYRTTAQPAFVDTIPVAGTPTNREYGPAG